MYTFEPRETAMEPVKVGIREFREKLATYVLGAEAPLAITRHGDTIGYFLPARRKRTEEEKAAFREAAARMQEEIARVGATEDQILEDFEEMHRQEKNARRNVA